MGEPSWRFIKEIPVPQRPGVFWTPALDYVMPGRLYRIAVEPTGEPPGTDQKWKPASAKQQCTADGDATQTRQGDGTEAASSLPVDTCAVGALIGKIGGSSAEVKPDKQKAMLFGVGRYCVVSIEASKTGEAAKTGALYLGVNDTSAGAIGLEGTLTVKIYEAL
jgi:hypothetical protein